MTDAKLINCLLIMLAVISCTMFIWTLNYINSTNDTNIPMAISAFNA